MILPLVQSRTSAPLVEGRGERLKQSTALFSVPARRTIVKPYSRSNRLQRATFPIRICVIIVYFNGS